MKSAHWRVGDPWTCDCCGESFTGSRAYDKANPSLDICIGCYSLLPSIGSFAPLANPQRTELQQAL